MLYWNLEWTRAVTMVTRDRHHLLDLDKPTLQLIERLMDQPVLK